MFPNEELLSTEHATLLGLSTELTSFSNIDQVTTLGQPRVFNSAGAKCFTAVAGTKYRRVTHRNDIVVRVPIMAQGYAHSPQEFFYPDDSSTLRTCSSTDGEDKNCANSGISTSIKDHLTYATVGMTQDASSCS
eukprot:UN01837